MQSSTSKVTLPATSTPKGAWLSLRQSFCGLAGGVAGAAITYLASTPIIEMASKVGHGGLAEGVAKGLFFTSVIAASVCASELYDNVAPHVKRVFNETMEAVLSLS